MIIHIYLDKLGLVIPSDLAKVDEICVYCESDLYMKLEYQGDPYEGPGFYEMTMDFHLQKCYERLLVSSPRTDLLNDKNKKGEREDLKDMEHAEFFEPRRFVRIPTIMINEDEMEEETDPKLQNNKNKGGFFTGGPSKEKVKAKRKEIHTQIEENCMIENVSIGFNQKYETKRSISKFKDEKANYFTRLSIVKKDREGNPSDCEMFIPVTLIPQLKTMLELLQSSSLNNHTLNNKYNEKVKNKFKEIEHADNYNQIYEMDLSKFIFVLVSEHNGEEQFRFEFKDMNIHFRKERKENPEESKEEEKSDLLRILTTVGPPLPAFFTKKEVLHGDSRVLLWDYRNQLLQLSNL